MPIPSGIERDLMFSSAAIYTIATIFWLLACAQMVHAATISVMQDGSGDFEQIQPALNAVASGDTLLIGPGEYLESNPTVIPGYSWDVDVFGFVQVDELTIIGSGALETVIGPTEYQGSTATYSPKGLVWLEGSALRISGVTLRNCYDGIHATNAPVFIDNCRMVDNNYGVLWFSEGSGGSIISTDFEVGIQGTPSSVFIIGNGSNVLVRDCSFDGGKVSLKNLESIGLVNCEIKNSVVGLQATNGVDCSIVDCRIFDCSNGGVVLKTGATCTIQNSEISGGGLAAFVNDNARLIASQSVFNGGYWGVMEFSNAGPTDVSSCHLFPGSGPAIRSYRAPEFGTVIHDMRNNFWDTSDFDELRSLILDGVDDPNNSSTVLFQPFVGGPVSTEKTTLDSIKAMYR